MSDLRANTIRLAATSPTLRPHLLRVLGANKTAAEFTLYQEYLSFSETERAAYFARREADPEGDFSMPPVMNMRMDRWKAESTSQKTFAVLENLYDKANSEAKLHAWASRISDPNTAVSLAYTGWKLSKGSFNRFDNSYFFENWKGYGARFKVLGEQVQKACTARFWEIAGRDARVKPQADPALAGDVFVPPEVSANLIPTTAMGWQIYDTPGAGRAARGLATATATALKMVGRNITPFNKDEKNAAAMLAIRARMVKVFSTYSQWGTLDGEPDDVLCAVMERYISKYLSKWEFPKTFRALDRYA